MFKIKQLGLSSPSRKQSCGRCIYKCLHCWNKKCVCRCYTRLEAFWTITLGTSLQSGNSDDDDGGDDDDAR